MGFFFARFCKNPGVARLADAIFGRGGKGCSVQTPRSSFSPCNTLLALQKAKLCEEQKASPGVSPLPIFRNPAAASPAKSSLLLFFFSSSFSPKRNPDLGRFWCRLFEMNLDEVMEVEKKEGGVCVCDTMSPSGDVKGGGIIQPGCKCKQCNDLTRRKSKKKEK